MANIKTIQIAFNLDDPYQEKLFKHFKKQGRNASFYGKALIQRDMEREFDKHSSVELTQANDFIEPISDVERISTNSSFEYEQIKITGEGFKLIK